MFRQDLCTIQENWCDTLLISHCSARVEAYKSARISVIAMDKGANSKGGGREEFDECDLNLAHRSLESLPDDVHVCNNLPDAYKITSLNLVGNRVSVLPDSLGNFINLKVLDISGNGLAYITPRIGDLRQLRSFVAKNNNLEDLPKEFSHLLSLEHLNLSGNRFESFFPQMFELVSLKSLLFGGNRVDVIPQDIQNLQRLVCYL